jgi:N-acetylmuramoyl-L-alanine amidase
VILDAGHGGRDSGMRGPSGVLEKDITLMLVQGLQDELEQRGYEVHLTRDTDTLIALADRPRRANEWKRGRPRAIFMSIHTNSGASQATGFETYFLSDARTADERRVAELENAAADLEDRSTKSAPAVDWILESLRNDYYVRASNDLAELVQRRLGKVHPGPDRGVKQAGFRVLVGAIMPAVLVETAYMSNPKEERLMADDDFRQRMVKALADAIGDFFHRHAWAAGGDD